MLGFSIDEAVIAGHNRARSKALDAGYARLCDQLAERDVDVAAVESRLASLNIAVPSWGLGTGGTRFGRFPGRGEPRDVYEKLDDCRTIWDLGRLSKSVSLHLPWDEVSDYRKLRLYGERLGLDFDAINSNTFQDQTGQTHSYKFGSLTSTDASVRRQAVEHNLQCIEAGVALGSRAITVWIGDGANFPGQQNLSRAFERYLDSMKDIYKGLPADWLLYIEHKFFEPAFYATVISDWGSSYLAATALGERAKCLVDLGHHAPNVNIEQIVARLAWSGKLGGFHFNDSKYGDDDLDAGSINPFQLFLIFNELVDARARLGEAFQPAYMLDQSHNITDPIESLLISGEQVARAYAKALLIDRTALTQAQDANDVIAARRLLMAAYETDVSPLLAKARVDKGGAADPIAVYRDSGYRARKADERPVSAAGPAARQSVL